MCIIWLKKRLIKNNEQQPRKVVPDLSFLFSKLIQIWLVSRGLLPGPTKVHLQFSPFSLGPDKWAGTHIRLMQEVWHPPEFCESVHNILHINWIGLQANKKGSQIRKIPTTLANQESETETETAGGEKQHTNRNFVFLHLVGPRTKIWWNSVQPGYSSPYKNLGVHPCKWMKSGCAKRRCKTFSTLQCHNRMNQHCHNQCKNLRF